VTPAPARPDGRVPAGHEWVTVGAIVGTLASAVLRAAAGVASGLLLCGGLALVLWAVTPGSESDAGGLLRGSAVAFASAHFLPVSIGGASVTLRPLLLTVLVLAVIASSAGRARPVRGRTLEALHGSMLAVTYAVLVDVATAALAPADAATPGLLAPLGVAVIGVLLALSLHRTAWNRWWRRGAPEWLQMALRGGAAAACLLAAAGALAVAVGLVTSFSDATAIADLTAGSAGDGFGQLLLGLAFLPNAVVAGIGYVSGAGFALGSAGFSPLATNPAPLPAIPLLAAAPDGAGSVLTPVVLVAPIGAAALLALIVVRGVSTRSTRLAAATGGALVTGLLVAGWAAAARGGVAGGPWSSTGVPVGLVGAVLAGTLLVLAGAGAAVAGWSRVPWSVRSAARRIDGSAADGATAAPDLDDGAGERDGAADPPADGPGVDGDESGENSGDDDPRADPAEDGEGEAGDRADPVPDPAEDFVADHDEDPVDAPGASDTDQQRLPDAG